MMAAMLGGGGARRTQRTIARTIYIIGGVAAVLVSLFNPVGIFITLVSAVASSFGGTAGPFNVVTHGRARCHRLASRSTGTR